MKKITPSLLILTAVLSALLLGCAHQHHESDPDAQTPTITAISGDISTVLNVPKELSVGVEISDRGTLSFQWYEAESKLAAGTAIDGATKSHFSPETNEVGIFYYYCVIVNRLGSSTRTVTSPMISYAVSESVDAAKPVIAAQPANVTADFGEDFTLSVIAYSADGGTLSYQWYFCAEGTEATSGGETATDENGTANNGGAASDESNSAGIENATAIDGANSASYSGTVSAESLGRYFCIVTNRIKDNGDGGQKSASVRTNTVIVSNSVVNANTPTITAQPSDVSAVIPAICVFNVGAYTADDGILTYQWYLVADGETDGTEIEGENSATLKIHADSLGRVGYYCVITNTIEDNGDSGTKSVSVRSETAWLDAVYLKDVVSAPAFTKQPTALNIAPYNQPISISCRAEAANGTVSYRWYKSEDGTTGNGTAVTSANSATLSLAPITEKRIFYYYCVATTVLSASGDLDIKSAAKISDVVSVACTGLPTLYLDTSCETGAITKTEYVETNFKLFAKGLCDGYKDISATVNLKGRGNSSWGMPKKGYNIKFSKKQEVFGLPKAKKWCIVANYSDKTLLRNKFASVFGNEILFRTDENGEVTSWNPHFVSVDVVLNGEYWGNYIFCEKITLTTGRIGVQDIADAANLADGGFILEVDSRMDGDFAFKTTKGRPIVLKDPDDVSAEIQERVRQVVQTAEDALYSEHFADELIDGEPNPEWWQNYIDVDSVIDWFIANEFTKNNDAVLFSSVYIYYDPTDGKLHFGPNWDFDISCGNINYNGCDNPEGWWIKNAAWISQMFKDASFVAKVQARWNEKSAEILSAVNSTGVFAADGSGIQSLADSISLSAEFNFQKWRILGVYVWPNAAGYATRTTYQSEVDYLIDWVNARYTWLDREISGL